MTKKPEVIKNPARQLSQMLGKRERYVPNYVRLGLDTPQPAKVSPSDFEYAFNKRKPFVTSSGGKREETVAEPRIKVTATRTAVPKQTMVSSGNNHEHTWHPVAQYYDEETIPEHTVGLPWEDSRTDEELEQEQEEVSSETINFDEIEIETRVPVKPRAGEKRPSVAPKAPKYYQLSSIDEGEYCVAVDGNIVHVSNELAEIEDMVEYILFDQSSPLGDISVENISVFKRLSVKTGVLVKD